MRTMTTIAQDRKPMADYDGPTTPESIARAKAARDAERAPYVAEGVRFDGDEIIHPPRQARTAMFDAEPLPAYTIVCPECLLPCGGANRGQADRAFFHHYVHTHKAHLVRGGAA